MDDLTYRLNGIENDVKRLITIVEGMFDQGKKTENFTSQTLYTLREAVELKYGKNASYTTISTNYALMPCCNSHYVISAGKRMWTAEQVREWLIIQDKDIPVYAAKNGVPLVGKIGEKYKKYMKEA